MATEPNSLNFTGFDAISLLDQLKINLQQLSQEKFNNFVESEPMIMIIEQMSYALDLLTFYIDRRFADSFIRRSASRSSLFEHAYQKGYQITGAIPAIVDVDINLLETSPANFVLEKGRKFSNGDFIWELSSDVSFLLGDTSSVIKQATLYQGETVSETFTSTGRPNQIFELNLSDETSKLSHGSVKIEINGIEWEEKTTFEYGFLNEFVVDYVSIPPRIFFGDGLAGNIPPKSSLISAQYILTRGTEGFVDSNQSFSISDTFIIGPNTILFNVVNEDKSSPGSDIQSIQSIKANLGRTFFSQDRAITLPDITAIADQFVSETFGRIGKAKAIHSSDSSEDSFLTSTISSLDSIFDSTKNSYLSSLSDIREKALIIEAQNIIVNTSTVDSISQQTAISGVNSSLKSLNSQIGGRITNINADISQLSTDNATLLAQINAISEDITNTLTTSTKNLLISTLTRQSNSIISVNTQTSLIATNSSDITTNLSNNDNFIFELSNELSNIQTASSTIATNIGESVTNSTGVFLDIENGSQQSQTDDELFAFTVNEIKEHVSTFLSNECTSNLVSVPILAKDAEGFYTAPPNGLVIELQNKLDSVKEATTQIKVTNGESFILRPVITVLLEIVNKNLFPTVSNNVEILLNNATKDLDFGQGLNIGLLACAIRELDNVNESKIKIEGTLNIDNITIDTDKLDEFGNLEISLTEIIGKPIITIEEL